MESTNQKTVRSLTFVEKTDFFVATNDLQFKKINSTKNVNMVYNLLLKDKVKYKSNLANSNRNIVSIKQ